MVLHTKLNNQELIIHVAEYLFHMGPRDILDSLIIEGVMRSSIFSFQGDFIYLQSRDQAQDVYWFSLHSNHTKTQYSATVYMAFYNSTTMTRGFLYTYFPWQNNIILN